VVAIRPLRKKSFITVFLVLVMFSADKAFLFGESHPEDFHLNKRYLESVFIDLGRVGTSPLKWENKDILRFSAILGSGSLLFLFDRDINDWIKDRRSPFSEDISRIVSPLGDGIFLGSSLIVLYASGELFGNENLRKTALLGLESWIISGMIVTGLKFLIGRERPYVSENSMSFHPFSLSSRHHSFPSGHASSAFAVATTIADQSEEIALDVLAYSLATLVAFSRIHDGKHWASDVFMGAAVGYFVSRKISSLNSDEDQKKLDVALRLSPQSQAITLIAYF